VGRLWIRKIKPTKSKDMSRPRLYKRAYLPKIGGMHFALLPFSEIDAQLNPMHPLAPKTRLFHLTLLAITCAGLLPLQAWRPSLYPVDWTPPDEASFTTDKLIQDFSYAGYRRGEEPIPEIAGPVFDVTAAPYNADSTGTSDSTSAIQAAIDAAAAAAGGVVFLPAGTYRVKPQGNNNFALRIQHPNIVLRGAGVEESFILNTSFEMHEKAVIRVAPQPEITFGPAVAITTDLDNPTRRIPVANASAFQVGDNVRMEWTFTKGWIDEHNQGNWWSEGSGAPNAAASHREITAVNPVEGWIEVDIPTRYTMRTRDDARLRKVNGQLSGIGLEGFSIGNVQHSRNQWGENDYTTEGNSAYDVHNSWLIRVNQTFDSWITNVHSYQPPGNTSTCHMLSNGIALVRCFRITVANCEMRRSQYGGGGGNGYMYRIQDSNEILTMDSIADFSRHGFVVSHAGSSGNVFLRCEDRETKRSTGSSGSYETNGEGSDHHQHFSHSNLFDMCHAHNSYYTAHHRQFFGGSAPHALTSAHGVYWNTSGSGTRGEALVRSEQARYGYVIGTSGTRPAVTNPTGGGTAPADHVEGVGMGAAMQPQSLYLDQLALRAQGILLFVNDGAFVPPTANYPLVATASTYGSGPISYQWMQLSGPPASIVDPASPSTSVGLLENGVYVFEITAEDSDQSNSSQVVITVAPARTDGVARWPFDEGSGATTTTSSGTISDAFGSGIAWSADTAGIGSTASLSFPGTAAGYIGTNLDAQALGIDGTGAKTITAWIKTSADFYGMFFGWSPMGGGGPGQNLRLGLDTGGKLRVEVSSGFVRYDNLALNDGNWHMVGVVIESGDNVNAVKLYINGVLVNPTSTGTGNPLINTSATGPAPRDEIALGIGIPGGTGGPWSGLLDDVRVFDAALDLATLDKVRAEMVSLPRFTWGGAGRVAAPAFWNDSNNSLPTHWARLSPPNMAAGHHATIQGGGIQKNNGLEFANGASMTLNLGAYYRLNTTTNNPIRLIDGSSLLINDGTFIANTQFLTISASSLEVVNGSFVYNHQATAGFGMNNGAIVTIRPGGLVETSNFFNTNNQNAGPGGTIVIDGGTLRASGPQADPLRANNNAPGGGGFDFTHPGGTIELGNFTGGNLTTYLEGKASAGFFKIDGTTVSGFGLSNAIHDRYLALTDNGSSGALTLTSLAADDYTLWAAGYPGAALTDPSADFDGDGLTNNEERIWGLDPTSGASVTPFTSLLDPATRRFTYTRRLRSLTGIDYTYQWSDGLGGWTDFTPANETASGENPVESVTVEVPAVILGPKFFLRVVASED